jgi:hypothetical protein
MDNVKTDRVETIFVFGSNEAGRHGGGAARYAALHCGAREGEGVGLTGRAYAIPTKDHHIKTLPLIKVAEYVANFLYFAQGAAVLCPTMHFHVTRIGCGLAGFSDEQIAPLFERAPRNCEFDERWLPYLGDHRQYFHYEE